MKQLHPSPGIEHSTAGCASTKVSRAAADSRLLSPDSDMLAMSQASTDQDGAQLEGSVEVKACAPGGCSCSDALPLSAAGGSGLPFAFLERGCCTSLQRVWAT